MNTPDTHPDMELLDRLRAGLLDGDPRCTELETHLQNCPDCRQRADWQTLLRQDISAFSDIEQRLDRARKHALHAAPRSPLRRRLVPLAVAASVALLAVVLVNPLQQQSDPETRLAATQQDLPELYEELDFYLWLADHKSVDNDSAT